jgi:chaperone modulatory protein CbpM
MSGPKSYTLTEVVEITGLDHAVVVGFIERSWICPVSANEIDHEDLARIHLIEELRNSFGANDEAIPIILHLMDQLYSLRHRMRQLAGDRD